MFQGTKIRVGAQNPIHFMGFDFAGIQAMSRWMLAFVLVGWGCGADNDTHPIVTSVTPPSRATRVDTAIQPEIQLAGGASVDPYDRKIVLYDVTGGARMTVAGNVAVEGTRVTYEPGAALVSGRDYRLVLEVGSVTGDSLDQLDGAESPEEPLSWPYALSFRTGSRPRVRAAYLKDGSTSSPDVLVRFSQPMNPIVTGQQIQVLDQGGKPLKISTPIWLDTDSARVELDEELDPTGIYTLRVGHEAIGEDGILLDGDDDGTPGEKADDFTAQFTGSQKVIQSRLE